MIIAIWVGVALCGAIMLLSVVRSWKEMWARHQVFKWFFKAHSASNPVKSVDPKILEMLNGNRDTNGRPFDSKFFDVDRQQDDRER